MGDFEVKDSGERHQFDSGMVRDTTEGKTDYLLALDGPMFQRYAEYLYHASPGQVDFPSDFRKFATRALVRWLKGEMAVEDNAAAVLYYINSIEAGFPLALSPGGVDFNAVFEGPMFDRYAIHLTKGAKKYAKRNWMQATGQAELERFQESALRHFLQWLRGERDEDHAAAVWFNVNGAEYVKSRMLIAVDIETHSGNPCVGDWEPMPEEGS